MACRYWRYADRARRLTRSDVGALVTKVRPATTTTTLTVDKSYLDEVYLLQAIEAHPAEPDRPTAYVLEHRGTFAQPAQRRRGGGLVETVLVDGWLTLEELSIPTAGIFSADSCLKCGNAMEEKHKCGEN
jgi:hypothetical protein